MVRRWLQKAGRVYVEHYGQRGPGSLSPELQAEFFADAVLDLIPVKVWRDHTSSPGSRWGLWFLSVRVGKREYEFTRKWVWVTMQRLDDDS